MSGDLSEEGREEGGGCTSPASECAVNRQDRKTPVTEGEELGK